MTRKELVELLYQSPQPVAEIERKVLDNIQVVARKDKLPDENGDYLVYHAVYGWCLYGFTTKDHWGCDDIITRKDGTQFKKIVRWAKLDFSDKEKD